MCRPGSFFESSDRHGVGCNYRAQECIGGAGHGGVSGGQLGDASLHRATNSPERTSSSMSCGDSGCRRLGSGLRIGQQPDVRIPRPSPDICRTSGIGPRKVATGMVADRTTGAQPSCALQLQKETRLEAIQQVGEPSLGECQLSLSERSGFLCQSSQSQHSHEDSGYRGQGRVGGRRSKAQAEKAGPQRRQGQRRRRVRERSGMSSPCGMDEQLDEYSDGCSAFELRSDCVGKSVQSASHLSTDTPSGSHDLKFAALNNSLPDLDSPDIHLSPVELMSAVCTSFLKSQTALGQFTRSCLEYSGACTMQSGIPSSSIWPAPPPRWCWSACKQPGIRRRKRRRFLEVRHRLLQLLVCTLNWEALGNPKHAPAECKSGRPISVQQHLGLERLEIKLNHFLKCPPFVADDLGRAKEKFSVVISLVKEFPQCNLGVAGPDCFVSINSQ